MPKLSPENFRMLATPLNDAAIPNYSNVLRPQDATLLDKGRSKGIALYDQVKRDGHAVAVLGKRARKVLSREWIMMPASDDPDDVAAAEFVERLIRRLPFDAICEDLLEANLYGFAASEIVWANKDGLLVPETIEARHQRRIAFDTDWKPRLLTRQNSFEGEPQPEFKWIIHRVGAKGTDPYGSGLGRVLFWHTLFKREGVHYWARFLEKYASPTPFARYPYGTPPSEQEQLKQHLADMVQRSVLVAPIGTEVSFLEAARTGAATYEEWCRFWDEQTSVAVLGETLSTNIKGQGSRAAATTHNDISDMIADADADLLSATLNETLIRWIMELNLVKAGLPTLWRPRPKNEEALEDQKLKKASRTRAELDNLFDLASRGYRPGAGLEQALSDVLGTEIVADPTLNIAPSVRSTALSSTALTSSPSFADDHDHGIPALAGQVAAIAQPALDGWLDIVRAELDRAVETGEDLSAFSDRLLEIYPGLSLDHLGQVLGDALTVAELTGYSDVKEETA